MSHFTLNSTVQNYPKKYPFEVMKDKILGAKYNLSLNFIGKTRAASLNQTYRNKTYTPNVLSFPLDTDHGEIFICPAISKTEAKAYQLTPNGYIAFLFIHGLLHLKGHDHGDNMDKLEQKYIKLFNIK